MKLLNPFSCLVSWVLPAVLQRMQLQGKTASCYTERNKEKIIVWGIRAGKEKHREEKGEKTGARVHAPRVVRVHRGRLNLLFLARFLRSCLMEGWIPSPQQWKAKLVTPVSIVLAPGSFIMSLLKKNPSNIQQTSRFCPTIHFVACLPYDMSRSVHWFPLTIFLLCPLWSQSRDHNFWQLRSSHSLPFPGKSLSCLDCLPCICRGIKVSQIYMEPRNSPYRTSQRELFTPQSENLRY